MATAVMVADNLSGFAGPATLYRIDPPMLGTDHVLLYYRPSIFGQPGQLNVILSTQHGAVFGRDVRPQAGTHITAEPNHALALMLAGGYQIVDVEPELPNAEELAVESSQYYDPGAHTVAEVKAYLAAVDDTEHARVLEVEAAGKARKTILGRGA